MTRRKVNPSRMTLWWKHWREICLPASVKSTRCSPIVVAEVAPHPCGTTPLWHHTPVAPHLLHHTPLAPHHSQPYYTTPQPSVLTPPGRQNGGPEGPCRRLFHHRFLWDGHLLLRPTLRPGRQHLHCRHRGGGTRPQRLRRRPNPAAPRHAPTHAYHGESSGAIPLERRHHRAFGRRRHLGQTLLRCTHKAHHTAESVSTIPHHVTHSTQ